MHFITNCHAIMDSRVYGSETAAHSLLMVACVPFLAYLYLLHVAQV